MSSKQQQYPLIIMSHGSGGDRYNISWLAEVFASNGYIVVAMDTTEIPGTIKSQNSISSPGSDPKISLLSSTKFFLSPLLKTALIPNALDLQATR